MKACFRGVLRQWHWIFFAAVILLTIGWMCSSLTTYWTGMHPNTYIAD